MFLNCQQLISLNIQNCDTSNVEYMNRIFYHCSSLISLNINSFNTSNVVQPQFCFDGVGSEIILCVDSSKSESMSSIIPSNFNNYSDPYFSGNNVKLMKEKSMH